MGVKKMNDVFDLLCLFILFLNLIALLAIFVRMKNKNRAIGTIIVTFTLTETGYKPLWDMQLYDDKVIAEMQNMKKVTFDVVNNTDKINDISDDETLDKWQKLKEG